MQSKWYYFNYVLIGLSIASYFATLSFITSFKFLDFDFYQVGRDGLTLSWGWVYCVHCADLVGFIQVVWGY